MFFYIWYICTQVIALPLRSNFPLSTPDELLPSHPLDPLRTQVQENDNDNGKNEQDKESLIEKKSTNIKKVEVDFCTSLNSVLPLTIRAVGWTPVTDKFSARFSASRYDEKNK